MDLSKLKECKCGAKNGMICPVKCSRIKLIIFRPEHHLSNPRFYSRVALNKYPLSYIIKLTYTNLKKSFQHREALSNCSKVIAYDTVDGRELEILYPNKK